MFPYLPYDWFYMFGNNYFPIDIDQYDNFEDLNEDIEVFNGNNDDPPPITTNPAPSTALIMRKELTGYPNYGNPSGNADILYTGNRGVWTFPLPGVLFGARTRFRRFELVIRGALDDHYNVPNNRYRMNVNINGNLQRFDNLPFEHGTPAGQRFNNWRDLVVVIPAGNISNNNRVTINNTSTAGPNDWIGFDWMEMRFMM